MKIRTLIYLTVVAILMLLNCSYSKPNPLPHEVEIIYMSYNMLTYACIEPEMFTSQHSRITITNKDTISMIANTWACSDKTELGDFCIDVRSMIVLKYDNKNDTIFAGAPNYLRDFRYNNENDFDFASEPEHYRIQYKDKVYRDSTFWLLIYNTIAERDTKFR